MEDIKLKNKLLFSCLIILILSGPLQAISAGNTSLEYQEAERLFARGNYSKAIIVYQSLLSLPSRDVPVSILYTRIADSYFRLNDYQKAQEAYRLALKEQKPSECAQTQYWIGFCCFLQGKNADAVQEFLKIPLNYPASGMWVGTAYYWAGRASEHMGMKEQAAKHYRKAAGKGKSGQERFAMSKADDAMKGSSVR